MVWDHIPKEEARMMEAVWAIEDGRKQEKEATEREVRSASIEALEIERGSTELITAVDPSPDPFKDMSHEEVLEKIKEAAEKVREVAGLPPDFPWMSLIDYEGLAFQQENIQRQLKQFYPAPLGIHFQKYIQDLYLSVKIPEEDLLPGAPYLAPSF